MTKSDRVLSFYGTIKPVVSVKVGNVAGRTTAQGYGEEVDIRKQYTGYERDDESGLDFAQARYYNPSHGRYTGVDPLTASADVRNPQTFNRYSYVLNSPYKFTDPLGLISSQTGACGNFCRGYSGWGGGLGASSMSVGTTIQIGKPQPIPPAPPPPPTTDRKFVTTGKTTFTYSQNEQLRNGDQVKTVNGKTTRLKISWKAETGYFVADDGKTQIKANRATSEIKYEAVDVNGESFTAPEDILAAQQLVKESMPFIQAQQFDNSSNCHGATFANGKLWIPNEEINAISLAAMGYKQAGNNDEFLPDQNSTVVLYNDKGTYVHSGTVQSDGRVSGKSGILPSTTGKVITPGLGEGSAWNRDGAPEFWMKPLPK